MKYFELTRDQRAIGTLTFNTPESKVNLFSQSALEELETHIDALAHASDLKALFIESGKKDIFIAGADIQEIKAARDEKTITALVQKGSLKSSARICFSLSYRSFSFNALIVLVFKCAIILASVLLLLELQAFSFFLLQCLFVLIQFLRLFHL